MFNLIGEVVREGIVNSDNIITLNDLISNTYIILFENGKTIKFIKQ